MAGPLDAVVWSIDRHDVITAVGGAWDEFARVNDAPWLSAHSAVGRSLFGFIDGEPTRRAYQRIFASARASGRTLRIPFRCDSPVVRRWMELAIVPFDDATVQFRTALLRSEKRDAVRLLDALESRSSLDASMCSFCLNVRTIAGWVDAEEASRRLQLDVAPRQPQIRHVICPDCSALLAECAADPGARP
ncbi:MAG: hypothetical protein DCC71_20720 [Proteobacteria bacterium]|nr:MAG: hypothetical protein DCC71_20720 [Pseudomonadota bacterium]